MTAWDWLGCAAALGAAAVNGWMWLRWRAIRREARAVLDEIGRRLDAAERRLDGHGDDPPA